LEKKHSTIRDKQYALQYSGMTYIADYFKVINLSQPKPFMRIALMACLLICFFSNTGAASTENSKQGNSALSDVPTNTSANTLTNNLTNTLTKDQLDFVQGNDKTNIIPFFNNRFRIDSTLDEITMIFYRERGSKPVILIKPDGSKVRIIDYDRAKVEWFDDSTFDMIKIKKPMPGPWQAIGKIKENSKIFIVSDVQIAVEPLPQIIFKGETLKVTGRLFNGENAIDVADFRDVVTLDVYFASENKIDEDNFGTEAVKVATFKDDGQMLDEYSGDSVFTGEFLLNLAPGTWKPTYVVKLPMATRKLQQTPIRMQQPPLQLTINVSHKEHVNHQLKIKLLADIIDVEDLIIDGKITFPDRQIERFSIAEGRGSYRKQEILFTESGIYRVDMNVFGKTLEGREFRLTLDQFTFNVDSKILRENKTKRKNPLIDRMKKLRDATDDVNKVLDEITAEEHFKREKLKAEKKKALEESHTNNLIMIILANTAIIAAGLVLFFVYRRKNKS